MTNLIEALCNVGFDFDLAVTLSECFTDNGGNYPAKKEVSDDVATIQPEPVRA